MTETGQEIPQADKPKKTRARKSTPKVDKPKVTELQVETVEDPELERLEIRPRRRRTTFPVYVKGKLREITRLAYEVAKKDPNLDVQLPEGSPFLEGEPEAGCKDC